MAKKKYSISIVIPCYRSENTISDVVESAVKTLNQREGKYDIVLVNDYSPDNVWNQIVKLSKKYPDIVKGLSFSSNYGQHAALLAGSKETKGDIVVFMDDDGQTDPADLWKLVDKLNEGYDTVCAKYPELKESPFRRFGSWLNDKMSNWLLGKPKNLKGSSYVAIRRFVIDEMIKYDKSYPYIGGLVYRVTKNCGSVEIEHHDRKEGTSGYTLGKLINLILNGFTAFSIKPLRVSSFIGILFSAFGFIYGILIVIRKIINPSIQAGYSSMVAILLFSSGIIMLMLGLIGEYVGRIYICMNNSPQYVVKEKTNFRK